MRKVEFDAEVASQHFSLIALMSNAEDIRAFDKAMLDLYRLRVSESQLLEYTAALLDLEIRELGGVEAAKRQIHSEELGLGFSALHQRKRLDLTLEALILSNPRWHAFFSEEELAICATRLRERVDHTNGAQRDSCIDPPSRT